MVMDIVLVHMGTDNKGMVSLCQFQCKLPADPVRFFRYDLSRLEGLPEMVGNHVIRAPVPARQVRIDRRTSASAVRLSHP